MPIYHNSGYMLAEVMNKTLNYILFDFNTRLHHQARRWYSGEHSCLPSS